LEAPPKPSFAASVEACADAAMPGNSSCLPSQTAGSVLHAKSRAMMVVSCSCARDVGLCATAPLHARRRTGRRTRRSAGGSRHTMQQHQQPRVLQTVDLMSTAHSMGLLMLAPPPFK
jgi:hypothetical protein